MILGQVSRVKCKTKQVANTLASEVRRGAGVDTTVLDKEVTIWGQVEVTFSPVKTGTLAHRAPVAEAKGGAA